MTNIQDKAIRELKVMKLNTKNVEILSAIAKGLGEVGGEKAINELKAMKLNTKNVEILSAIAFAIGRAGRSI